MVELKCPVWLRVVGFEVSPSPMVVVFIMPPYVPEISRFMAGKRRQKTFKRQRKKKYAPRVY